MKRSTTTSGAKSVHFPKSKGAAFMDNSKEKKRSKHSESFFPESSELSMDEEEMTTLMKKLKQKMAEKKGHKAKEEPTNKLSRKQPMVTKHKIAR